MLIIETRKIRITNYACPPTCPTKSGFAGRSRKPLDLRGLGEASWCRRKSQTTSHGFTLLETLIVLLLLSGLLGVSGFLFIVSLRAWDAGLMRAGIREDINYAMEGMVRDLKQISQASLSEYSSITHTIQYNDLGGTTYMFYLYNANDAPFDSTYSENLYDLRKANITQGDNPASGDGLLILRDLVSPDATSPATALTINPGSTEVTLDLVVQRANETVSIRTKVRPRNL